MEIFAYPTSGPKLTLAACTVDRTHFSFEMQRYDEWSLLLLEIGRVEYELKGRSRGICEGSEMLLCPPMTDFRRKAIGGIRYHFLRFVWEGLAQIEPFSRGGVFTPQDQLRWHSCLSQWRQTGGPRKASQSWAEHLIRDLLYLVYFEMSSRSVHASLVNQASPRHDPRIIEAARKLRDAASEGLRPSITDLADLARMDPAQFTRSFRSVFQMTPRDFLTHHRMERIKKQLLETDWTLDHIAQENGYRDGFYLSRQFNQQIGVRPSVFRREQQV